MTKPAVPVPEPVLPRPALRPERIKKWIRAVFLSPYLTRIPKNERTLDLACGWGFSFLINPRFFGVELDHECVRYCRLQGYHVCQADLLQPLPFPAAYFDTCFSHDVLEHFELEDLEPLFTIVQRVLRPGGIFMNILPNEKGYLYGLGLDIGHKHFVTPGEIERIAVRTGFRYRGSYSSPVPEFMNKWFMHAKYVTLCEKI